MKVRRQLSESCGFSALSEPVMELCHQHSNKGLYLLNQLASPPGFFSSLFNLLAVPCLQSFSFLSLRWFSYFPWQSLVPFMWQGSLLTPSRLPEVSEVPVEWDKGFSHSLLPGSTMRHQSAGKALWLRVLLGAICALSSGQIPSVQLLPRSRGTIG